MTIHNI